jgi:peptidoglycan/LPS O-acetylase OafA/YrhL
MFDHLAKFRYRADIDGLRAIAVIGVVLFHAGLGVSGGFVGVDVFFVISGFLITSLILRDLDRGSFSIVDFWERRARRIFPALAVVVMVTLIAGWFLMLPFGFQVLGQSVVALTVFASNMQFWRTSGYFDPSAEENPLLHTWSLSVEEQFYLVVPLLLLLVFTLGRQKWVGILLSVGIVVSLVGAEMWLRRDPSGSFYLLPSRAWELGAGSLMALARPLASSRWRSWLGWLGLALIFYAFFGYDAKTAFPGMAAIPPVLGTVLLIWSGMSDDEDMTFGGAHRLLASKVLVAIGLLSYSFYLWHWPFFAFHRYLFSQAPAVPLAIGYISIALLLSALSLRYVEKPFRKGKLVTSRKHVFLFTGLVSALVLIVGLSMWRTRGVPSRMPTVVAEYDAVKGDEKFKSVEPFSSEDGLFVDLGAKVGAEIDHLGAKNKPCRLMVWGDSHADVLLHMIDEICNTHNVSGIAAREGGVAPVLGYSGVDYTRQPNKGRLAYTNALMKYAQELSESGELQEVLLAFRWSYYIDTPQRLADDPLPKAGFSDALIATIQALQELGLKVSVLLEVPIFGQHVPKAVALHHWRGWPLPHLSKQQHEQRQQSYQPLIQRLHTETPNVNLIDASPSLISEKDDVEFLDNKGVLLYRDEHHLTKTGTMRLKPLFEKLLLR